MSAAWIPEGRLVASHQQGTSMLMTFGGFSRAVAGSLALATATCFVAPASAIDFTGAGATFPAPVYSAWAAEFKTKRGSSLNYQAIGSGGGKTQIFNRTVDFGASDAPVSSEDLSKNKLLQFPTVIGSIVPIVNLDGIKANELKLSGAVLADIYLGKITKWDDKAIADLNAGVKLPSLDILPVSRSDGSGTTYVFTTY
eukprot:gene22270-23374_t